MIKPKNYTLNTKVALSFIILGLFLLAILFVLIVPKMQKEKVDHTTNQIEHMITLTKLQLKLAVKFLIKHGIDRRNEIESQIKFELNKAKYVISQNSDLESINKAILDSSKNLNCNIYVENEKKVVLFKTNYDEDIEKLKNDLAYNSWHRVLLQKEYSVCPMHSKRILYKELITNTNKSLIVSCNPRTFEKKEDFESKIKQDIQKSFELTKDIHHGKTYLMWIDIENTKNSKEPLYNQNDDFNNKKYCVSKISDISFPKTGLLTAKQILDASDKEPIRHLLDSKTDVGNYKYPALTWVKSLNDDKKRKLLFITTIYEEDFDNKIDSSFWKILPASLIALLFAITLGFLLFRKLFKSIFILSTIAKEVNNGNMSLRSNIKGKDDIGALGIAFDNMLDSIQTNFKLLDNKVEDKTKELRNSLEEKDVLLKEIHHRVKNNLAMTINLIKLQKSKIDDEKTKSVLIDVQERIFTMELLHRKLYESKDLSSISLKKYISELVEDLDKTYKNNKKIQINSNIDDLNISIEYALPCGLIITECVTNAYKYAFENDTGILNISFKMRNNTCTLIISDNGIGLPKNIDVNKTKTLGLRLISTIVKGQLLGKLDYIYEDGAKFNIIFELDNTNNSY